MKVTTNQENSAHCEIAFDPSSKDTLRLKLIGAWVVGGHLPSANAILSQIDSKGEVRRIIVDGQSMTNWNSGFLIFLIKIIRHCEQKKIKIYREGIPQGAQGLLDLAFAVPEKKGLHKETIRESFLSMVGGNIIDFAQATGEMLAFIGEAFIAFYRLLLGKARFRRTDLGTLIQDCGAQALPIITLISVLVGLILAFVGAVQLKLFGAEIFVADLVGIGTIREMGAMMTAIIMAGHTGAAYAAQIGTMQVNEEVDALKTLGISPMEFLVLPRILALVLMMPLLCLYADFMGIIGGLVVGVSMLDLPLIQYLNQTQAAVDLNDFMLGGVKSAIFGILVALSGCLKGMQCERSASAVGLAATSAVVMAIVAIIVTDGIFAVLTNILGL